MRRKSRFVLVLCVCMAYLSCVNVLADVKPNAYVLAENCESTVMEDGYTEYEAKVVDKNDVDASNAFTFSSYGRKVKPYKTTAKVKKGYESTLKGKKTTSSTAAGKLILWGYFTP